MSELTSAKSSVVVVKGEPGIALNPIPFDIYIDQCILMANERLNIIKAECKRKEDNFKKMDEGIKNLKIKSEDDASKLQSLYAIKQRYEKCYNEELTYSFNNYVIPTMEILRKFREIKAYCESFNTSPFISYDPHIDFLIDKVKDVDSFKAFIREYTPYEKITILR